MEQEPQHTKKSFVSQFLVVKSLLDEFEGDESAVPKIIKILEEYQTQPELLDPHLEEILSPLMQMARRHVLTSQSQPKKEITDCSHPIHRCFKLVRILCKVRGYKTVVKFFPHEVTDLEPTLDFLVVHSRQQSLWETQYVLLLWLSIIVLIPFDLCSVDSRLGETDKGGIVSRIIHSSMPFLSESGTVKDAAGILLARLFSRPDVEGEHLSSFFRYSAGVLETSDHMFLTTGVINCLAQVFKFASRDVLIDKIHLIHDSVTKMWDKSQNILHRKLLIKVSQRIGLTYLKPRIAPWRYQRGSQTIFPPSSSSSSSAPTSTLQEEQQLHEDDKKSEFDDEIEVHESIANIIDQLLNGLRDQDTVVRWSAAKGIGRITMRLPSRYADEVVGSVLDLFGPLENDGAWHGGCLCLAELARRGLLLPSRLAEVVPVVLKALVYDVPKGAHSIGAHVRDAACYVCWAFARAYSPDILQPYVEKVASTLLIVAAFDREINCRRAACAAFQENVGRQGNFPHGIEINTSADYFTVGNRSTAYKEISVIIARYDEYRESLILHLVNVKLSHWDKTIRELSSEALHNLTPLAPQLIIQSVLPILISRALSPNLPQRHGAVWGISRIITKLAEIGIPLDNELQKKIRNIVMKVEKARLYRGKGGIFMRGACCGLIEAIATSGMPLMQKTILRLQDSIDENLKYPNEEIQENAVDAMRAFGRQYLTSSNVEIQKRIVLKFIHLVLRDENVACKRGYSLGLGVLPKCILLPHLSRVVDCLIAATQIQDDVSQRDAETRRNAVKALIELTETVGIETLARREEEKGGVMENTLTTNNNTFEISVEPKLVGESPCENSVSETQQLNGQCDSASDNLNKIRSTLLRCMTDYCCDNRGDVGSWVREVALDGLDKLVFLLAKGGDRCAGEPWLSKGFVLEVMCAVIKQILEKIDRTRQVAGRVFLHLLHSEDLYLHEIPERKELDLIFPKTLLIHWSASEAFSLMVKLLELKTYRKAVLSGLCFSAGGITKWLAKPSSAALLSYMSTLTESGYSCQIKDDTQITKLQKLLKSQESQMKELFASKNYIQTAKLQPQINEIRSQIQIAQLQTTKQKHQNGQSQISAIATDFLLLLKAHRGVSRVTVPILNTIVLLLHASCFESLTPERSSFTIELHNLTRREILKCRDVVKLIASIEVFSRLLSFSDPTRRRSFQSLFNLLACRYPRVREASADALYTQLTIYDDCLPKDHLTEVLDILAQTNWNAPLGVVRPQVDKLYDVLGLTKPKRRRVTEKTSKPKQVSHSYKDLIKGREMGY